MNGNKNDSTDAPELLVSKLAGMIWCGTPRHGRRGIEMAYLWPCFAKNLPINWPKFPKPTIPTVRRRSAEGSAVGRVSETVMLKREWTRVEMA